jgi:hypothetical protein
MLKSIFNPILIVISALLYALAFGINSFLMDSLTFSVGVNWIFLPAGLRLLLTLLFGFSGAIGIALASVLIAINFYFQHDLISGIGAGLIGGLAPYFANLFVFKNMSLTSNLETLDGNKLLNCIFIYSLISPVLHQAWFYIRGINDNFIEHVGVMFIGDLVGTLIIIYLAKLAIRSLKNQTK